MGLIGVRRVISSAGLPGADGVVVDYKIFFSFSLLMVDGILCCCCWLEGLFGCRRFHFINFSLARCGPQQASQASSRLVKWLALIICFAFQDDESRIATCTQRP